MLLWGGNAECGLGGGGGRKCSSMTAGIGRTRGGVATLGVSFLSWEAGRWGVHDRGELLEPLTQVGLPRLGRARLPLGASGYHGFGLCQEQLASDGSRPVCKTASYWPSAVIGGSPLSSPPFSPQCPRPGCGPVLTVPLIGVESRFWDRVRPSGHCLLCGPPQPGTAGPPTPVLPSPTQRAATWCTGRSSGRRSS